MRFTCDDVNTRWPEYIYRELSAPEQSWVVRHLEECIECRAEEREWRELLEKFDSIASLDESMETPPELVVRVKRQTRMYEELSQQFSHRFRRWVGGVMAACLLATISFYGLISRNFITPIDPGAITSPMQKTVLQSIYNQETLRFFNEQGILEKTLKADSACIADTRIHHESHEKIKKESSL
jgi:hypothetical protein